MPQVYCANVKHEFANGAIGYAPSGSMDPVGPFAKVQNCPVEGFDRRYTCYATGPADTFFSIPACTRIKGKHVRGFFVLRDGSPEFRAADQA